VTDTVCANKRVSAVTYVRDEKRRASGGEAATSSIRSEPLESGAIDLNGEGLFKKKEARSSRGYNSAFLLMPSGPVLEVPNSLQMRAIKVRPGRGSGYS